MSSTWYRDGLRFECSQCGNCCTGAPGYVWLVRREIERLSRLLGLSLDDFGKRYLRRVGKRFSLVEKPNGDCVFYDGGCAVYSERPRQCRTFPFWRENLASRKRWGETAEECRGVGKGRLFSVDEIRVIRRGEGEASQQI